MLGLLHDYEIRKPRLNDASQIVQINLMCWKENYKNIINQSFLDNLDYQKRLMLRKSAIEEEKGIQLVACYRKNIIGFCDAGIYFLKDNQKYIKAPIKEDNIGEIYAIYVHPNYQKQGVGKALFKEVRAMLKQKGLVPFYVWVLKDNKLAKKFYESQGGKLIVESLIRLGDKNYLQVGYKFD